MPTISGHPCGCSLCDTLALHASNECCAQTVLSSSSRSLLLTDVASAASNMSALKVIAIVNREYKRTNTLTGVLTDCIHLDPFLEAGKRRQSYFLHLANHESHVSSRRLLAGLEISLFTVFRVLTLAVLHGPAIYIVQIARGQCL